MKTLELLSVGIDVGTTTTQVIFSRLALVNRAAVSQVPRYEFVDRKIIWQSRFCSRRWIKTATCVRKSCWRWCWISTPPPGWTRDD